MRFREQPSALAFSLVALVFAVLAGLLIPLAGGSGRGSASDQNWTPPPAASPTLHATPQPALPTSVARAEVIATATATATAKATATDTPPSTPTVTTLPSPTASLVRPTQTASPVPTLAPTAAAMARITEGPVNLRAGPGPGYMVLGIGEPGSELGILGRSEDSQWVKLCCVANGPIWASAAFVTLPADLNTLSVVR